jgi:AraC-like DNA-binding protein
VNRYGAWHRIFELLNAGGMLFTRGIKMQSNTSLSEMARTYFSIPFRLCSVEYFSQSSEHLLEEMHCFQVLIGMRGKGVFRTNGEQEFVLHAGQSVIMMPNVRVEQREQEKSWEMARICFECTIPLMLQFRLKLNMPFKLKTLTRIHELVHFLHGYHKEAKDQVWKASEMVHSLLAEMALQNMSVKADASFPDAIISKVIDYIHCHFSNGLNLAEVSGAFGYSSQHLNKLFKSHLGYPIYQYILKVQLEHAAEILQNEDLTVEEVADRVGMEPRSFYRLFHKKYRVAPGVFRKAMKASYDQKLS